MSAETYFRPIAIDVFAETLGQLGACLVGNDPWAVRYKTDPWFVEIVAFREEGPKYCPRVHIGPLPERSSDPARNCFDILHTLPEASPLRRYNLVWRYTDEAEMRSVYVRVLREIFEPYAIDVLRDAASLEGLMRSLTEQLEREWDAEIRDRDERMSRAKAAEALVGGDYRAYLLEMGKIPAERQRASERARIDYTRKRLLKPGI